MGLRNRHTKPTTNPYIAVGLVAVIITGIALIGFKLSNGHQATALNHRLEGASVTESYSPAATDTISGSYQSLSGQTVRLSSLKGHALMVWFIAGGCASCAASIPAVARHLGQLDRDHVHVIALGLSGDFSGKAGGLSQLASFGSAAAGPTFSDRAWTWGMASAQLSERYDPSGIPDYYLLVNSKGEITYQNTAPVSTMDSLLRAASKV